MPQRGFGQNTHMNRDEFERDYEQLHGKRYSTIIFLPHARAKFRKLKVSHRLLFSLMSLILSSLSLAVFFTIHYVESVRRETMVRTVSGADLERQLADANRQMLRAHSDLQALTLHLIDEQRKREQQLRETQRRYESLRVLTKGQEDIARAHRTILEQRTAADRLVEIGLGLSVGVLSSLVATVLWAWLRSKPLTSAEAERLDVD